MKLSFRIAVLLRRQSSWRLSAFSPMTITIEVSMLGDLPTSSERIVSTVPSNNDVNPYGVAFVPQGFREGGPFDPGDILVSDFNNNMNQQGTGTTIVRITPGGACRSSSRARWDWDSQRR